MGVLSLFPTHTPTTKDGVYPIVHASLLLLVVPVLAATSTPLIKRADLSPKVGALALLSERISEMSKEIFFGSTSPLLSRYSSSIFPDLSSTLRTAWSSCLIPPAAKTP